VPEGDTIRYAAHRMRPVLEGRVPDEIRTPQPQHALDHWSRRLFGRAVTSIAGIGNIWKAEGCWEARIDPWWPLERVTDAEVLAIVECVRPRMSLYDRPGPRHPAGDGNRTTFWCPGCQS
jgi:formamidopyrimidine-DNA glycosylase